MLIKYPKNRVFIGFIAIFYLVSYYVSYLVRLIVSIVLGKNKNVLKVAYFRGFSGFVTLLICLLSPRLICNKKSPVIRRGCFLYCLLLSLLAPLYRTDLYIFAYILLATFRIVCDMSRQQRQILAAHYYIADLPEFSVFRV